MKVVFGIPFDDAYFITGAAHEAVIVPFRTVVPCHGEVEKVSKHVALRLQTRHGSIAMAAALAPFDLEPSVRMDTAGKLDIEVSDESVVLDCVPLAVNL